MHCCFLGGYGYGGWGGYNQGYGGYDSYGYGGNYGGYGGYNNNYNYDPNYNYGGYGGWGGYDQSYYGGYGGGRFIMSLQFRLVGWSLLRAVGKYLGYFLVSWLSFPDKLMSYFVT